MWWIVRNENGTLVVFDHEPKLYKFGNKRAFSVEEGRIYTLDSHLFPEVTFENSPQKINFEKFCNL